ncbi:MAG: class I SAM-dependent methyltransferase [Chloroflexi bacterium]|nr:class I SAM-dependent methyltransferase [Chloroflexota bacterium]
MLSRCTQHAYRLVERLYDWSNVYFIARYRHVLGNLPPRRHGLALEVGCGDSLLWTSRLAARNRRVIAMDISSDRARHARKLASRPHVQLQNAAWVVGDGARLPFRSRCFETVACVDVIEHIPSDVECLQEIARVTAPRGRAVLSTMYEGRRHYLRPLIFSDHLREYTVQSLDQLCHTAGVRVISRFSFYRPLTIAMRELQGMIPEVKLPLASLILRIPSALLAYAGEMTHGSPGGIGVVIESPPTEEATP